ncbi:MAG: hypothetical protein NTW87_11680 [Planctomycetota bacterium]|nr:hypothetical protein [Planctomycetota bacterium]
MKTWPTARSLTKPPLRALPPGQALAPLYRLVARWLALLQQTKSPAESARGADPAAVELAEEKLLAPLSLMQRKRLHRLLAIVVAAQHRRHSLPAEDKQKGARQW